MNPTGLIDRQRYSLPVPPRWALGKSRWEGGSGVRAIYSLLSEGERNIKIVTSLGVKREDGRDFVQLIFLRVDY